MKKAVTGTDEVRRTVQIHRMIRKRRVNTKDARDQEIDQSLAVTREKDQFLGPDIKGGAILEVHRGIVMRNLGEGLLHGLVLNGTVRTQDLALEVVLNTVRPAERPTGDPVLPAAGPAPLK